MNTVSKQSTLKNKKQLTMDSTPKVLPVEMTPSQSSLPYNAYSDKHTSSYFRQKPVRKHLKQLAQVFEKQPKSKKNSNFIRSISQWIKPSAVKEEQFLNRCQNQKIQQRPYMPRFYSNAGLAKSQKQQKIKQKGSPYRVFPIFIKPQSNREARNKGSQSTCNLPNIEASECKVQQVSKLVHNKLSRVGKKERKKIDNLHSLKHKKFLQFLNKKKLEISNSLKLINPEASEAIQNEK